MQLNGVLEGGGVRGIGLAGALRKLEESGVEFTGLAGTSAGSLVAALYAAGYRAADLKGELERTNFSELIDKPFLRATALWRRYGMYAGARLYQWVFRLLAQKDVREFRDVPAACDLKIIASDLTNNEILVFDRRDYPRMKVAEAVRMSSGIPLFFEAYRFGERLVVDGGLLTNYPLWVFEHSPVPTIGLKLVSGAAGAAPEAPDSFPDFLVSLVSTMLEAHDKKDEQRIGSAQTIHIPTGAIGSTKFDLSDQDKTFLYNSGYVAASEFVQKDGLRSLATSAARSAQADTVFESLRRMREMSRLHREKAFTALSVTRTLCIQPPHADLEAEEDLLNESDEPCDHVTRSMVADTPTDFYRLNCQGWVAYEGERREAAISPEVSAEQGRIFGVRIGFRGIVVPPKHRVRVCWRFRWPGAISRDEDYWIFPANYYERAPHSMRIVARFPKDPRDQALFVATDELRQLPLSGPELENQAGATVYKYEASVSSPTEMYVLRWRLD